MHVLVCIMQYAVGLPLERAPLYVQYDRMRVDRNGGPCRLCKGAVAFQNF